MMKNPLVESEYITVQIVTRNVTQKRASHNQPLKGDPDNLTLCRKGHELKFGKPLLEYDRIRCERCGVQVWSKET